MHTANIHESDPRGRDFPSLEELGFGNYFETKEPEGSALLGRVLSRKAMRYEICTRKGIVEAEISGKLSYMAQGENELPVVGDWVLAVWDGGEHTLALMIEVLSRKSVLARSIEDSGEGTQVMAANVDALFIVWPLDRMDAGSDDTSLKTRWGGIQRFMTLASAGSMMPVLVFTKADVLTAKDQSRVYEKAVEMWPGLSVRIIGGLGDEATGGINADSLKSPVGLHDISDIAQLLSPASTSVLVGLSGAGKSTLANALRDDGGTIRTGAVRRVDNRGRHTTTHRELYFIPNGALVIDSPGIREIGIWGSEDDVNQNFTTLVALAADCKFSDCSHNGEPDCAIQSAIAAGTFELSMLLQYRKQISEIRKAEARNIRSGKTDASYKEHYEAGAEKRKWMAIHKGMRTFSKENRSKGYQRD